MKNITTILLSSLLTAGVSQAALISFDGGPTGTGTSVNTAENWSGDVLPTATDEVVIASGFKAIGSIGGGSSAKAGTLIVGGELSGTWIIGAGIIVDGGSISLSGPGGAYKTSTTNLINGGTFTFTKKTADEFMDQYASTFSIDGTTAVFGADPLVMEAGDTAIVKENPTGGITIAAVPEPSSAALLGLGGLALILRRRK